MYCKPTKNIIIPFRHFLHFKQTRAKIVVLSGIMYDFSHFAKALPIKEVKISCQTLNHKSKE